MVEPGHTLQQFASFWVGTVISPRSTFSALRSESIWYGVGSVGFYALLYVVATLFLVVHRLKPVFPPFLPIAEEQYYTWQLFFTLPVTLLGWGILGGSAWLIAVRIFNGGGSPSAYLVVLAFAFFVPQLLVVWPPEMITASLYPELWGALGDVPIPVLFDEYVLLPTYIWLGLWWSLGLSTVAVRVVGDTSWPASMTSAAIAIALTMGFYILFIR